MKTTPILVAALSMLSSIAANSDDMLPLSQAEALDASVNFANMQAGFAKACRNHLPIEFEHQPGLDHDPLMEKTIDLQLNWVRARLDAKPWSSNCGSAFP